MHALVEKARRIVVGLRLHVLAEGERHRPALGGIGQDRDRPIERGHDLLGPRDPVEIARHGLKAVVGAHRSVGEVLDLLQNGIGPPAREHIAKDQKHGEPVDMRDRGGGDHVGRARADRGGAGHHPPPPRGLGEGDRGKPHRLLVMGAIGRQRVTRAVERLAHASHVAMAEDREHPLEQPLLHPVDLDALGAEEANHRLGRGQPDCRCHGARLPSSFTVDRPDARHRSPKRANAPPCARPPRDRRCGRRTTRPPARRISCAQRRSP